jgi:hypothetical protein
MGIKDLDTAVNEMDVQDRYRVAFRNAFKDIIFESNYNTDGIAYSKSNKLTMIVEQKYGYNFMNLKDRARAVSQVIKYVKNIHDTDATKVPKVAVIGDENETFVVPVSDIINYISIKDYQWSLSPSSMYKDEVLINDLIEDDVVKNLYIYNPKNEFREIVNKIKEVNKGISVPRTLTEKNIDRVFEYFCNKITMKIGRNVVKPNDMVNLFAHIMMHPDSVVLKGDKLFTTMFKDTIIIGNVDNYNGFVQEFSRKYTPKQKHVFTAILDRLIEDTTRRKQGEFFTPTIWVDKAHEYIASVYGDDWKEKYVVWDPAWGTGNLTRDYRFKELYVSTLNQSDIDTAEQMGYNPEATKFQYDFLNDDYAQLPEGLKAAIEEGRQIIVLMNPPYGRSTGVGGRFSNISMGATTTKVSCDMKHNKVSGSDNLYTQFFYQCVGIGIKNICSFTPSNFQTGVSFMKFRDYFFNNVKLVKGYIFQASNFADVADDWSIQFSVFTEGKYDEDCAVDILEENKDFNIESVGDKRLVSTDNKKSLKNWVEKLDEDVIDFPKFSSSLNIKETNWGSGIKKGTFGTVVFNSNSPSKNAQSVYITSGGITENVGKENINKFNLDKLTTIFSVRRLVKGDWINWYDEYLAPNEEHEQFKQFKNDSLIYSLFESKSNQSSLRQITYKDKLWDIKNEFFWMSKDRMKELADENGYDNLYNDARTSSDRHVYNLLFGEERIYDKLSDDAKVVLDKATELVEKSMKMRQVMADDHNHLDSWDAGYAQLKIVWKEYFKEDFKEFRQLYKNLEDRMRPLVYELGFLMK